MGSAHEAYDAVMGPRARGGVRVSPPEPGGKDPMALFTAAETAAMRRALRLAASPDAPPGPNPRVGCVIVSAEGRILAEGHHRGAGTAHAEVDALTRAGERARGAVAVITLEPCDHRGRTGPCTRALLDAGIAEVVYAQDDPNPLAAGGAARLRKAGVRVRSGLCRREAERLNRAWTFAVTRGRPLVTWKLAASLDGRVAAADSTSRWITPSVARRDAHSLRRECDAIMVGTGTVLADDPALTVRDEDDRPLPRALQPLRVVVGRRTVPEGAQVLVDDRHLLVADHDPRSVLAVLAGREVRHVLLEGGPTLAAAFLSRGLIDEVVAYLAPVLLGAGPAAVDDFGAGTIAAALRLTRPRARLLGEGDDLAVRIVADVPAGPPGGEGGEPPDGGRPSPPALSDMRRRITDVHRNH